MVATTKGVSANDLFATTPVSSTQSTNKTTSAKSKSSDFSNVMDKSMKNTNSKDDSATTATDAAKVSGTNSKTKTSANAGGNKPDNKVVQAAMKSNSIQTKENNQVNDDLTKAATEMFNQVKEELDMSEEELNSLLESLGMTMFNLLDVKQLQQVVLQANGADDISAMLVDEQLSDQMNNLMQSLNDIIKDNNLQDVNIKEVLQNMQNAKQEDFTTVLNATQEEQPEVVNNKDQQTGTKENQPVEGSQETKQVQVVVEKENQATPDNNHFDSKQSASDERQARSQEPDDINVANYNKIMQGLTGSMTEEVSTISEAITKAEQMNDIVNQIVDQIKVRISSESTSMDLQLNPEHLGRVSLTVSVGKDGLMTAHLLAQNTLAKEAIESQLQVLKDQLNEQGLKVNTIDVAVSDMSFNTDTNANAGAGAKEDKKNNRKKLDLSGFDDVDSDMDDGSQQEDIQPSVELGSNVNLTA